jgi:hypothetical protein
MGAGEGDGDGDGGVWSGVDMARSLGGWHSCAIQRAEGEHAVAVLAV